MPNDPRVKFKKKKMYDPSHNIIHFGGGGSGGMRSIYEDGTPPPDEGGGDTGGGGETGGGGTIPIYRPTDTIIPQPLKPSLNPGEITGITIGSIAAAAAALEATRRALEKQRRPGMQPVSQTEDLSSRQSGGGGRRPRPKVIPREIVDMFEMTPTRPFAPLSKASSPSSSGAATPDLQSARSSASSSADLQSARSRTSSGTTTPDGNLSSIRPGARQFQQQPSAPIPPIPPAPAPAPAPAPEIISPSVQLNKIKSEITLLENQLPTETDLTVKNAMKETIKILKKQATALEKTMPARPAPSAATTPPVERPAPPPESVAANTRSRSGTQLNQQLEQVRTQENLTRIENVLTPRQKRSSEGLKLANADLARPNVPKQKVYLSGRRTTYLNRIKRDYNEINRLLNDKNIPEIRRRALLQQQEEYRILIQEEESSGINKTLTTEINTSVHTPANDNLRATQPTREFESRLKPVAEGTEMQPLERQYFAEIEKIVQAAMQQMGSRKPLERARVGQSQEPSTAGKSALERARTAPSGLSTDTRAPTLDELRIIGPEFSEAQAAGVGFDLGDPRGPENRERIRQFIEEPLPPEPPAPSAATTPVERPAPSAATTPPEPVRRPRQVEEMGEEIGSLRAQNAIAEFNDTIDPVLTSAKNEGFVIPEAPEHIKAQGELAVKKYQYEQALEFAEKEGFYISPTEVVKGERVTTGKARSKKKQLQLFEEVYQRARAQEGGRPSMRGTAPAEVRATAPEARARAAAPAEVRAPSAATTTAQERLAQRSQEIRSGQQEINTLLEARTMSAPAPEVAARRRMGVPELPTQPPVAPEERASFAERQSFFEETSRRVAPPIEPAGPSPPPSAPGSGTATPQEGATVERTPAERASLAEEVRLGLSKKPGRQKAKINYGKSNSTTRNPLDIFVSPQHRNIPSVELHPGAKNLNKALSELGSRVPKLVPTKAKLISMGTSIAAEGGGMVAGFFAGSEAGKAMSNYFATHPPKNRSEEYGQALATSMVALGVGNLVAKAVTYAIRQGVSYAVAGVVSGSISGAGAAGATALGEAALFATIATTTQFYTTKSLEDAGYSHEYARGHGAAYATVALMAAEEVAWLAKGGPWNLAADAAFITSELFIIGFGIWSYFEETAAGREQDEAEAANREEIAKQKKERDDAIAAINSTNNLRQDFMLDLAKYNYDFDALYATLSNEERVAMGIASPEAKAIFQRQVESAFDPFGAFQEPNNGLQAPVVLTQVEQDRRDVFNEYINWYINELRGVKQPPFNVNDPRVQELEEYSGGTWQSAAGVTATTNYAQSERTHPLIENAQNEIINAFHNERKTIEEMPPDVVRYANLDPNFRNTYEAYIVTEAQAQIFIEFNRTQFTYNDMDPKLVEIANRDPTFRAAADAYYQTLANQARDLNLSISEVARLNSLMERDQAIEIGKLNEARNLIISRNQAENQAAIDAYNANILREINIYGPNFESIIRNINDQALLTGHTFLYATTPAALYEQLHMEMPELELVDPDDEIDEPDQPAATWKPGKGRKVGDTAIYSYRYNLTDEQNQELDELARREYFINDPEEMKRRAALIYQRDKYLYEQTDQERADDLGMTLEDYYAKFGIPIDQLPIANFDGTYPTNGRVRMPDGRIETYVNGKRTSVELPPEILYDPNLPQQPNGNIKMPDGSMRTYLDGKVTFVRYPSTTPIADRLTPDQINAGTPQVPDETITPTIPTPSAATTPDREPTYEELKVMYPDRYQLYDTAYKKSYNQNPAVTPEMQAMYIEGLLRSEHTNRLANGTAAPLPTPSAATTTTPTTSEPTYEQLKMMYNEEYETLKREQRGQTTNLATMDANIEAGLRQVYSQNPKPLPGQQQTLPVPEGPLKNGNVKMPDGSTRTYKNGLVVEVSYPSTIPYAQQKTPQQINDAEGVRPVSYIGPTTTPETPKDTLKQGAVKMPDGSKRIYIDGKVVSVAYPDGTTGPTINEINAAEGVKQADAPSITNTNPMQAVDDLFKGKTPKPPATTTTTTTPAPAPEEEVVLGNRLDSLMRKTTPAPSAATTPAPAPSAATTPAPTTTN